MFGGLVRLVLGLRQLWLRSLKLFFDRRFPRHFGFSLALHGSNIDPANWLRHLRQILDKDYATVSYWMAWKAGDDSPFALVPASVHESGTKRITRPLSACVG